MTITRIYRIHCDFTGCPAHVEHQCSEREVGGPGDARQKANRAGWFRDPSGDHCPLHSPRVEIRADATEAVAQLDRLQAEARQAIVRTGRGRITAACDQP